MNTFTVELTAEEIRIITHALVRQIQGDAVKHAIFGGGDQKEIESAALLGQRLCEIVDPSLKQQPVEPEGFSE